MATTSTLLLAICAQWALAQAPPHQGDPFQSLAEDKAWARLPHANPSLPEWAKKLAGPLPKTTARMLELDYLQRERNPLGKELSSLIRWTVADALKSPFGKKTAEEDLSQKKPASDWVGMLAESGKLPPNARVVADFARKLTLAGYTVTDEEFAEVLRLHGPEKTTAIVHSVAYANFHNRVVLGLGAGGEPTAAISLKFPPDKLAKVESPTRPPWDDLKSTQANGLTIKPDWDRAGASEIDTRLEQQKARTLRIPLPDVSRFAAFPPKERENAQRVLWTTVSAGYQPELTRSWFAARALYLEEAKVDRVFTNSMFWVVTRTNNCFY